MRSSHSGLKQKIAVFTGLLCALLGLELLPPIFQALFQLHQPSPFELGLLWFVGVIALLLSTMFFWKSTRLHEGISLAMLPFLFLAHIESASRLYLKFFSPEESRKFYIEKVKSTYPENSIYVGHALLQFTGQPGIELPFFKALGEDNAFNEQGFMGKQKTLEKPPNTVRVACLGGSTTLSGYPKILEELLNDRSSDGDQFETLNFGLGYWTTAHSLVNFVLNVLEYDPDVVVIHHAWNDNKVRGESINSDYSHKLQYFHEPEIPDRHFIRISIIYRWVKFKWLKSQPDWLNLGNSIFKKAGKDSNAKNQEELTLFKRNIGLIIDIARMKNIEVILTTMPHSTREDILYSDAVVGIQQANGFIREIYEERKDQIHFVDLDSMMTGQMEGQFIDVAHLYQDGIKFKAERIFATILEVDTPVLNEGIE